MNKFALLIITIFLSTCRNNTPPSIRIIEPKSFDFEHSETVEFKIEAKDEETSVDLIEMYIDGELIGGVNKGLYFYNWELSEEDIGGHTILIIAEDSEGGHNELEKIGSVSYDYLPEFYGNFKFEVIREVKLWNGNRTIDTINFDGEIRKKDKLLALLN